MNSVSLYSSSLCFPAQLFCLSPFLSTFELDLVQSHISVSSKFRILLTYPRSWVMCGIFGSVSYRISLRISLLKSVICIGFFRGWMYAIGLIVFFQYFMRITLCHKLWTCALEKNQSVYSLLNFKSAQGFSSAFRGLGSMNISIHPVGFSWLQSFFYAGSELEFNYFFLHAYLSMSWNFFPHESMFLCWCVCAGSLLHGVQIDFFWTVCVSFMLPIVRRLSTFVKCSESEAYLIKL